MHGNEILATEIREYEADTKFGQSEHTVRSVAAIIRSPAHKPPQGWDGDPPLDSALAVFVGYILFDAWIGNTDRHHENWGFINSTGGDIFLAHVTRSFCRSPIRGTHARQHAWPTSPWLRLREV